MFQMRRLVGAPAASAPDEEVVTRRRMGPVVLVALFLFYVSFRFVQMFVWFLQWLL